MPKPRLAKLTRPRLHGAVPRERLFRLLDEKREHPVVWVAGPPGSGKSTLVASYLQAAPVPAIWYLLDKGDSDPATFFYYLSQAVSSASRKRGKPLPLLTPEYLPDLEGFSRRFVRDAFSRLPEGSLLVVDNYHEIADDSALHKMINAAVSEIPPTANLVVVSRTQPPALFSRAKVAGELDVLGWDSLRLDAAETAAIIERRKPATRELIDAIHVKSGGWVAGVRLMMEGELRTQPVTTLDRPEALESAFDYFAAEVFESAPAALQSVLVRTAFLPRFTAAIAENISGDAQAGKRIEHMFKRRLFIDRRLSDETTYQYHDLFRAFLQNRAKQTLTPAEVASITSRSASLLLDSHLTDDAFGLFVQAQDWEQAKRLFLDQAETLISHGRWQTLDQWGDALPEDHLESDPWLRYWLGRSKALVNVVEAFPILESAYESFCEKQDVFGQLLCSATMVETLHFLTDHWDTMGVWLERLKNCLEVQEAPLSPDDELRIHAALFLAAENSADPVSPIVPASVAKVVELLPQCVDVNLRVSTANMLHYHVMRSLDDSVSRIAAHEARPVLDSPDLSADRHALYYLAEFAAHANLWRFPEAFECLDRADAIIETHGLVGRDHLAGVWRTLAHYGAGELLAAKTTLLRTDKLQALDSHVITAAHENARARVAFGYGYFEDALKHNQAAIDIIEGAGPYVNLPELVVLHTYMSISADQRKLAQKALKRIRSEPGLVDFLRFGGAIALLDAWRTLRYGDIDQCIDTLRGALKLAHDSRDRQRMRSFPKALEELLPIALARDIETDVTRRLITDCGIAPPPTAPESWPWPIKIYTLGRFEILIDGKPAAYGRKSPKRTLALLKALIALGETNVPEQRLADLLWPDLEGDAAHESLAAALHRLRRLLGDKDALFQSGGALSINQQRCFVDARAFEAYGNDSSAMLELYRGDFLSGDGDVPWAASMRERLRGKFIRAIESLGRESELEEAYDEAIAMYLRGIDADDLVEPFYRGLMRCYAKLDRRAEAAGVFRRLRQRLSVTLGSSPAPETQRLFDEIGLERESSN